MDHAPDFVPQDDLQPIHPRDFADALWARVLDVAYGEALRRTHNQHQAEDLAEAAVERLMLSTQPIHPYAVPRFVRTTVYNLFVDQVRHNAAAMRRGGELAVAPEDLELHEQQAREAQHAASPSSIVMARETEREQVRACREMLGSLNPRHRRLIEMAQAGHTHAEIATALGFASAGVVKQTLHRVHRHLAKAYPQHRALLGDAA